MWEKERGRGKGRRRDGGREEETKENYDYL